MKGPASVRRGIRVGIVIFPAAALLTWSQTIAAQTGVAEGPHGTNAVQVPFVGCASDGQVGPLEAPKGKAKSVPISASAAARLAYYAAENGPQVLGPRGWYCFGTYGSNGANLFLSPVPINGPDLFSGSWKGFSGPAIQISVSDSGTSGRFEVAAVIARVFPAHQSFVKDVISEGIEPASSFPTGRYPNDKLTYLNQEKVEFETPANTDGLGTRSRLLKNDMLIRGAAILDPGDDGSLTLVSIRLPANMSDVGDVVIKQAERDAGNSKN